MTHALCSRTWHAISAEKHTANCIKAGCCVSFLVFFLFYSRLTDILRCFFQFLFPKASGLACPGEGCKTHEWQDEAETEKLHPGFACVIEWAGMGTKKHWLWLWLKFLSLEDDPVAIVAMFQHYSGTMCLADQCFTLIHLSHFEPVCFITAQIPVQSLAGLLSHMARSAHSARQNHKLRRQAVEWRRGLCAWDKDRQKGMEG